MSRPHLGKQLHVQQNYDLAKIAKATRNDALPQAKEKGGMSPLVFRPSRCDFGE